MRVDVTKALVEELFAHAHVRLLPDEGGLAKPDLAAQLVDRRLRLGDQSFLGGDLVAQAGDHHVDGVDLGDRVVDLRLDVVELVLVVDLLSDAAVVIDARLVNGRRITGIAVDCRGDLHRLRSPCRRRQDRCDQQTNLQRQILTYRRTPM
ncbi:MAG: hypothetical protein E6I82_04460 [Chloroflexi bacterium]|nr:MAG: hypothetical protein E6I82_04460 [Chloroflexota bacterium]